MHYVSVFAEDRLSQAVGVRLLTEGRSDVDVDTPGVGRGAGQLRANLRRYNEMADWRLVLVLTDLDTARCPASLVRSWSSSMNLNSGLMLRVAVRSIESWLMADAVALAKFLRVRTASVPRSPDTEAHAKRRLLEVAARAPRALRDEIVPPAGSLASQGVGYNEHFSRFVRESWCPETAATRSPSLARSRTRISQVLDAF